MSGNPQDNQKVEVSFDPSLTLPVLLEQHLQNQPQATALIQYDRIMRLENYSDFDLSSIQVKFSTSAPLRAALKADIIDRFPGELLEFYGLTEGGVSCMFVGSVAQELDKRT